MALSGKLNLSIPILQGGSPVVSTMALSDKLDLSIPVFQGGSPVVYRGQVGQGYAGRMEIKVDGALPGFIYRIVVQEMNPLTGAIHRQKEALLDMRRDGEVVRQGDEDKTGHRSNIEHGSNAAAPEIYLELIIFDAKLDAFGDRVLPRVCRGIDLGQALGTRSLLPAMSVCLVPTTSQCVGQKRDGSVCVACVQNDASRHCKDMIERNLTVSRLRSSKKSEEIYSGKCTNVIVNSQGGVGSSSFMRVLRKSAPYVDLNSHNDRDGLKHAPATVFRPVNGRLLFKTRHGELGCARKALIILGDPVHSIESTHRRFNASHINKWRKGACRQAWPIAKPLAEIWSEIKTTGQDTTGLSHYVNSWLEAANRADWPVRIVDTKTLYNNATQVARYLGVRARDLQAFRKLQYTPKPYNSSAPVQVKSLFDSLHRKIEERLESWSKSRNGGDEKLWKPTGNVTQTTGTLLKAKQGA